MGGFVSYICHCCRKIQVKNVKNCQFKLLNIWKYRAALKEIVRKPSSSLAAIKMIKPPSLITFIQKVSESQILFHIASHHIPFWLDRNYSLLSYLTPFMILSRHVYAVFDRRPDIFDDTHVTLPGTETWYCYQSELNPPPPHG